jgi:hypothetical protein
MTQRVAKQRAEQPHIVTKRLVGIVAVHRRSEEDELTTNHRSSRDQKYFSVLLLS